MEVSSIQINHDPKGNITASMEVIEHGQTIAYVTIISKNNELNNSIEKAVKSCIRKLKI